MLSKIRNISGEQAGLLSALIAAAFMCLVNLYASPEQLLWMAQTVSLWGNIAILAAIALFLLAIMAKPAAQEIAASRFEYRRRMTELQAGEGQDRIDAEGDPGDWTFPNGMSPYLTNSDRLRISQAINPKLNDTTGTLVKAGIAHGMTAAQVAAETGLSDTLVRRYAAIFRRGEVLSQPIPLSVESE